MLLLCGVAQVCVAGGQRIGRWNNGTLDGWSKGAAKPAIRIQPEKGKGTEGKGCLLIQNARSWSQAAATDRGKNYLDKGKRISMDVFARREDYPTGTLKLAIAIQSEKYPSCDGEFQEIVFDEWQTLEFSYDRKKHKKSPWALINILTLADTEGILLIDNVRILK